MPSKRKRIGYLPSPNVHELIHLISNNENLSQSKVVGVLVEEALLARGLFNHKKSININRMDLVSKTSNIDNSFKYDEMDELISDKGITYNKKIPGNFIPDSIESNNSELFEQFKQFIIFKEMLKGK